MSLFPLYDQLAKLAKDKKACDQVALSNGIAKLNFSQLEIVYALIYHHALLEQKTLTKKEIPYNGICSDGENGPLIEIKNLPELLQNIINEYIVTQSNS